MSAAASARCGTRVVQGTPLDSRDHTVSLSATRYARYVTASRIHSVPSHGANRWRPRTSKRRKPTAQGASSYHTLYEDNSPWQEWNRESEIARNQLHSRVRASHAVERHATPRETRATHVSPHSPCASPLTSLRQRHLRVSADAGSGAYRGGKDVAYPGREVRHEWGIVSEKQLTETSRPASRVPPCLPRVCTGHYVWRNYFCLFCLMMQRT